MLALPGGSLAFCRPQAAVQMQCNGQVVLGLMPAVGCPAAGCITTAAAATAPAAMGSGGMLAPGVVQPPAAAAAAGFQHISFPAQLEALQDTHDRLAMLQNALQQSMTQLSGLQRKIAHLRASL